MAIGGRLMVGDEDPLGETVPLKVTFPEKPLRGVKNIEILALVPLFTKNWFGGICI